MIDSYRKGMQYEAFLKRAFKFDKRLREPHTSEFENLVRSEQKKDFDGLYEIKKRMKIGCDLFMSNGLTLDESEALAELTVEIDASNNSEDIYTCVKKGLKATERFI